MSYKKQIIRGSNITWTGNTIFPSYPSTSGSHVSQKRINRLKHLTKQILLQEKNRIEQEFKTFALKRYRDTPVCVLVDIPGDVARVDNTVLCNKQDLYGESDGEKIWIAKEKMNDAYLLGTLLHEALHYAATFNGRYVCEADEHTVFRALGDDC